MNKQIMAITGHCSSTAVRAYKKVSHYRQEELSLMLQSSDAKVSDKENQAPNTMIVPFEVKVSLRSKSQSPSAQL